MRFHIYPDSWKERYKRDYLRTLINKRRLKREDTKFITGKELNDLIENRMQELKITRPIDAVISLIEDIYKGAEY